MKQLDLNLLRVLRVLLEVRNTCKAAEQLNISQPAVSRSLSRLRDHFKDELFIRCAYGLEPTSKAEQLGARLPAAMDLLTDLVDGDGLFEPTNFYGRFTIAINGFISQWVSPKLIHTLSQKSPNAELNIINWEHRTAELLLDGQIDIGVSYFPQNLSKQLLQQRIARDKFVFICRKDHPISESTISLAHFQRYPLAQQLIPNWNENANITVQILKQFGIDAKVQLRSNQLSIILEAIRATDMLFPCSQFTADLLSEEYKQLKIDPIFPIPESDIGVTMANKRRRHPLNAWLQSEVKACIESTMPEQSDYLKSIVNTNIVTSQC